MKYLMAFKGLLAEFVDIKLIFLDLLAVIENLLAEIVNVMLIFLDTVLTLLPGRRPA